MVPATLFVGVAGLDEVYAVTAALCERSRTGIGQEIEVPMFESVAEMVLGDHLGGRTYDPPLGPSGYERVLAPERRPLRTKDGYVCVLIYSDRQWESFLRAIDKADWLVSMPEFLKHEGRPKSPDAGNRIIAEQMRERPTREWLDLFHRADIPSAQSSHLDAVIADPDCPPAGAVRP